MKDIIFKKQDDAKESPLTFVTKIGRGRSLPISDCMYFRKLKALSVPCGSASARRCNIGK